MIESLKIKIDEKELNRLLLDYYKELYNDKDITIKYNSKFRYIGPNDEVTPNVWGILSRNINGNKKEEVIPLLNDDITKYLLQDTKYELELASIDYDINKNVKSDNEMIIFKGLIIFLKEKQKIKKIIGR